MNTPNNGGPAMSEPQFTKGPYRVINKIEDDEDRFHVVPSGSTHYIIATIGNCQHQ